MINSIQTLTCLLRSPLARMTLLLCMLSISLITEAFVPIRACPEPRGACKCTLSEKSVLCTRLGSLTRRLPTGIPSDTKRLVVKYSTLNRLGPNAFRVAFLLEHVDLSHNWIADISDNAFRNLVHLETLILSANKLRFVDSNVFLTLNKLKILDLSTNNLIVLTPQNFVHLSSLDTLNLRGNPIMCASPDAFYQLQKLQTLLISNSSASLNSKLLSDSPSLSKLSVSFMNTFTSIPENFLENNILLKEIRFENLPKLNSSGIPNVLFSTLESLDFLSFSACNLSYIPRSALDPVKWKLKSLDLSMNPLYSLSDKDLTFLYHLEKLNLRQTKLHTIETNALQLNSIVSIDLTFNQLSTLKESVFGEQKPSSLERVELGNNPWACDCSLRWLAHSKFFQESNSQAICVEPLAMRGLDIYYKLKVLNDLDRFVCQAPNITTFGTKSNIFNSLSLGISQKALSITLSCQASGFPKPKIRWIIMSVKSVVKNKKLSWSEWEQFQRNPLMGQHRSCVVCEEWSRHPNIGIQVDKGGDLILQSLSPCDAIGIYICEAQNDISKVQKMFIISRTEIPGNRNSKLENSCHISANKNPTQNLNEATTKKQFTSNLSTDVFKTKTIEYTQRTKRPNFLRYQYLSSNEQKICIEKTLCPSSYGKTTNFNIMPHASHEPNKLNDQSVLGNARNSSRTNFQPSLRTNYNFLLISISIIGQLLKTHS